MTMLGKFNVLVQVRKEKTANGPKMLSDISARIGTEVICTRTIPGVWSESQAHRELQRFPERFTCKGDWTVDKVKAVAY